jgi:hypothetical protein
MAEGDKIKRSFRNFCTSSGVLVKDVAVTVGLCVSSRAATTATQRNEDDRMNHLVAGFIADRGRYPWDVVS